MIRDILPPAVLKTLEDSFESRIQGLPDSETIHPFRRPIPAGTLRKLKGIWDRDVGGQLDTMAYSGGNIDNGFRQAPISVDDMLERTLYLKELSVITKVYDRCRGIVSGTPLHGDAIWQGVQWIRNIWGGSSSGFVVKFSNRDLQSQIYNELVLHRRLVRDSPTSSQEHPGCACWREVVSSGAQALHLLIGDHSFPGLTEVENERLDEIHIDWTSPCSPSSRDVCEPEPSSTFHHLSQVLLGLGVPDSPFNFLEVISELEGAARHGHLGDRELQKAKLLKVQWETSARQWSAQGYSGEARAQALYDQVIAIREEALKKIQLKNMVDVMTAPI